MKNQTKTLNDAELDKVTGGKYANPMTSFLTTLQQLLHETQKAIVQNIRA